MGWLGRIDNLPIVLLKQFALFIRQAALWVVQDEPGAQGGKCCVDVNGIGVTWEVHRMHPMVWEVAAEPFDSLEVGGEPMLNDQISAKPQNIRGIEQGLFLSGDEEFFRRPFQPLLNTNLFREVIGMVSASVNRGLGADSWRNFGSSSKYFCIKGR